MSTPPDPDSAEKAPEESPSKAGSPAASEASLCLEGLVRGDRASEGRLFELVYAELRQLANACLRRERSNHTLQPTALVHEAWMRLVDQDKVGYQGRGHFFSIAAMAMRRVLIDHARAHKAQRRGGGAAREPLGTELAESAKKSGIDLGTEIDLLTLDEGLSLLKERSERAARIVELRFFTGLSEHEVADVLGIARSTVTADWRAARAWLSSWMNKGERE